MYDQDRRSIFKRIIFLPVVLFNSCLNGLSSLAVSFERFLRRFSNLFGRASDTLGNADTKAVSIFRRLFSPIASAFHFIGTGISQLLDRLGLHNARRNLGRFLYWLCYPLVALAAFLISFSRTRSLGLIWWSIPVGVLAAAVLVLLWQVQSNRGQMARSYQQAIDQAVASGAFDEAQLLRQKLIQLGARADQLELQRIEELAESGKWEQAIAEAERISPLDKPGLGAGHFWLVNQYLQGRPESLSREQRQDRAAKHLEHVKTISRSFAGRSAETQPDIVYLEASLMIDRGQIDQGMERLNTITEQFLPALILSMEVNAQLNRGREAIRNSVQISDAIRKSAEIQEQLTEPFFPLWCFLLSRSGEPDRYREAIRLWHRRFPESDAALVQWSNLQFQEMELLTERGSANDLSRATKMLLDTTAKFSLNQRELLSAWLLNKLPPSREDANYLSLVQQAETSSSASPILLEVLGTAAYLRQKPDLAIELLERAVDFDPSNAVALNNLAFILSAELGDSGKSRALELADKAVQLVPHSADIRETRGMLLIHFKQWEQAIDDLTFVLANGPQTPDFHAALATAYRAIGKIEMASIHQSQAE